MVSKFSFSGGYLSDTPKAEEKRGLGFENMRPQEPFFNCEYKLKSKLKLISWRDGYNNKYEKKKLYNNKSK